MKMIEISASITSAESALLVAVIAGVLGASLGAFFGRWSEATDRRRTTYAEAVRTLFSWAEYPYRIRRRTTDSPDELSRLADIGHDLQERLRWHEAWIAAESRWMASTFRAIAAEINADVGPACSAAWNCPPITSGAEMVLGNWGPKDPTPLLCALEEAVSWRFGPRRLVGWLTRPNLSELERHSNHVPPS